MDDDANVCLAATKEAPQGVTELLKRIYRSLKADGDVPPTGRSLSAISMRAHSTRRALVTAWLEREKARRVSSATGPACPPARPPTAGIQAERFPQKKRRHFSSCESHAT